MARQASGKKASKKAGRTIAKRSGSGSKVRREERNYPRIDERAVQIVERVPESDGRWSARETLLRAARGGAAIRARP